MVNVVASLRIHGAEDVVEQHDLGERVARTGQVDALLLPTAVFLVPRR